jgi:hypothetical protein
MRPLPYREVVDALRPKLAEGSIAIVPFAKALAAAKPMEGAALSLSRALLGPNVDTKTVREVELSITTASPDVRVWIGRLAAVATEGRNAEQVEALARAVTRIGARLDRAVGTKVPPSVVLEATVVEAARITAAAWEPGKSTDDPAHAEVFARRIAHALGLAVVGASGIEDAAASESALAAFGAADPLARMRAELEARIRASLPEP